MERLFREGYRKAFGRLRLLSLKIIKPFTENSIHGGGVERGGGNDLKRIKSDFHHICKYSSRWLDIISLWPTSDNFDCPHLHPPNRPPETTQ